MQTHRKQATRCTSKFPEVDYLYCVAPHANLHRIMYSVLLVTLPCARCLIERGRGYVPLYRLHRPILQQR